MTDNLTAIMALSFLLGAILLCRVGYQIYNRIETMQRHQRIPSSATTPTLAFDAVIGCFLIALVIMMMSS